ncbi:Prenyltransferase and squalene oxidase repeat protein [Phycisphaerae bacterium RAS1]|nr:Prenyltransferase and squalene oxidase repeat protein [Phycisphaerae bacterium RAS1]
MIVLVVSALLLFLPDPPASAPRASQPAAPPGAAEITARAAMFLLSTQDSSGGWASDTGPGISALVLKALIQEPTIGPEHPAVKNGVAFVLRSRRDDGGIYSAEGLLKNYETSVALSMLALINSSETRPVAAAAQKYLKDLQWDESEGKKRDDPWYGGAGYGRGARPDLSNLQYMLDALRDSGVPQDDPAYQKALVFIQRCQMRGESNDQPYAKGSTQGGFIYSPANGGESKAEQETIDGRTELRCYGSMTYAGFKSMLYAGLKKDDPRVKAAVDWISKHWTLDHNPNMPDTRSHEGLFYYYHTFGRAMAAYGQPIISDARGEKHVWREELLTKLAKLQKPDGSWVNDADRWMEGHPALTTAYAMLAIQAARGNELAIER